MGAKLSEGAGLTSGSAMLQTRIDAADRGAPLYRRKNGRGGAKFDQTGKPVVLGIMYAVIILEEAHEASSTALKYGRNGGITKPRPSQDETISSHFEKVSGRP